MISDVYLDVTELSLMVSELFMLNRRCTMPRGIETGVEVEVCTLTAEMPSHVLEGVAVMPHTCRHSFVTLQVGRLSGGNSVDGLERTYF